MLLLSIHLEESNVILLKGDSGWSAASRNKYTATLYSAYLAPILLHARKLGGSKDPVPGAYGNMLYRW